MYGKQNMISLLILFWLVGQFAVLFGWSWRYWLWDA
jgi:hypothetical protein